LGGILIPQKQIYNILIQVDIDGDPPIPIGSKQSYGNLLFLAVFQFLNFRGNFEGLNEVFLGSSTSIIVDGFIDPPK
jgi:hypothetical protein